MSRKRKIRLLKLALGTFLGAGVGLLLNQIGSQSGSQCMILCQTPIAMAYFGLVGLLLSIK